MNNKFHIDRHAGKEALIVGEWGPGCENLLKKEIVNVVVLNQRSCWEQDDISFLAGQTIEELHIQVRTSISGLDALSKVKGLKRLVLDGCLPTTDVDFTAMESLEECFISWSDHYQSVFQLKALKHLFISGYPAKDLTKLNRMNLEVLELSECAVESLDGIQSQENLKRLSFLALNELKSLSELQCLSNLEDINIYKCQKVTDILGLEKLPKLAHLYLVKMGKIESLSPLQDAKTLKLIDFSESTHILDGNLAHLTALPQLKKTQFKGRKHYSHFRIIGLGLVRKFWKSSK